MKSDRVFIPPLKIQGIKTKIVPLIRDHVLLEPDTVWIEPFMGSGVVGFNIAPRVAVFSDINPHIIEFYNQIKAGKITALSVRVFLEKEGKLLEENDDAHYYEVRRRFNQEHDPLDFLFLNRSCFNGMMRFNKDLAFNVPYGHKPQRFARAYVTKIVNQVAHVEKLIRHNDWTFICQPFQDTIRIADSRAFIYCDPPYIGRHVDYYDNWDENAETALRDALMASEARFMLSTWDHNAYRSNEYIGTLWGFCHKVTKEHFYHVGARESNRNPMVEALLTNYPLVRAGKRVAPGYEQMVFSG